MTQQLTEAFRTIADDLETGAASPPSELLWRHGTRRRWRRRGGFALAVATAVALVALVAVPGGGLATLPAARDRGAAVTAFPQRIGHQWFTGTFHAGDGPVAMLLERVAEHDSWDEPLGWFAVSPSGHQSRLALAGYGMPTLSPDGRWVGYWAGPDEGYLLQGTTSEAVVRFRDVPDPQAQAPSYWNARGDRVFVPSGGSSGDVGVVLGLDGTEVVVPGGSGVSFPYGWVGSELVGLLQVVLQGPSTESRFAVQGWRAGRGWAPAGNGIQVPELSSGQGLNQFSAGISPDGTRLAVVVPPADSEGSAFPSYLFDLPGGAQVKWNQVDVPRATTSLGSASVPMADNTCPMAWRAGLPLGQFDGNTLDHGDAGLVLGRWQPEGRGQPLTVTEGRLGVRCILAAAGAIEGQPAWSVFGTADNVLAWWWRELLLALIAVAGLVLTRRARARRRATSVILGE